MDAPDRHARLGLRFGLFAGAAVNGIYWMILGGIIVHGICFDFFFVVGQIYIDRKTSPESAGRCRGCWCCSPTVWAF